MCIICQHKNQRENKVFIFIHGMNSEVFSLTFDKPANQPAGCGIFTVNEL